MFCSLLLWYFMYHRTDKSQIIYISNTQKTLPNKIHIAENSNQGINEIYSSEQNTEIYNSSLNKIINNFRKKNWLEILENKKISIFVKLDIIEKINQDNSSKYTSNLYAVSLRKEMEEFLVDNHSNSSTV